MRLSRFFEDLNSAYAAELDDLTTDSAGHDILADRLRAKRAQVPQLLPMIECNPEMVAVAFHGGIACLSPAVIGDLVTRDPEELPDWALLQDVVELAPWAADLAKIILADPNGDQFMVVTACLEYLHEVRSAPAQASQRQSPDNRDESDESDDDFDADGELDLEEAGADWLAEQGFDHKDRFSGD